MADKKKALVLLVHGSRDPGWMEPFERMRADVAERLPGVAVKMACLQFCGPDVSEAVKELAKEGINQILITPVFISAHGHVLKDVPKAVEEAKKHFPELKIAVADAIGETPEVMEAMREALVRLAGGCA